MAARDVGLNMTAPMNPRPYIVTIQDGEGNEIVEHVVAYDLIEAITEANIHAVARKTSEPITVLDVRPDAEAIAEHQAVETKRMSNLLAGLRGEVN